METYDVIVMSQSCDIPKVDHIVLCPVWQVDELNFIPNLVAVANLKIFEKEDMFIFICSIGPNCSTLNGTL